MVSQATTSTRSASVFVRFVDWLSESVLGRGVRPPWRGSRWGCPQTPPRHVAAPRAIADRQRSSLRLLRARGSRGRARVGVEPWVNPRPRCSSSSFRCSARSWWRLRQGTRGCTRFGDDGDARRAGPVASPLPRLRAVRRPRASTSTCCGCLRWHQPSLRGRRLQRLPRAAGRPVVPGGAGMHLGFVHTPRRLYLRCDPRPRSRVCWARSCRRTPCCSSSSGRRC